MNKKYLIPILVVLTFIILGLPLFIYGVNRTFFYSIDPDVVYITNALLYAKAAIVSYADHPGTPTIMLLNYSFFPLRLIAKYVLHQGFIQWSFDNFAFLMYYCRIFELLLFCLSFFIFLKVIFKFTKSNLITFIAWISIFFFLGFGWGMKVVPENLSFFLTAISISIFLKFVEKRSYLFNAIMVFIAGLAVANKFTSIFLLIPALFLPLFISKLKIDQLYARIQLNIIIAVLAFYIGILPVLDRFPWIKYFVTMLFSHAGTHGTGALSIFDWPAYSASATSLIAGHPIAFTYICLTVVLAIYLVVKKKIKFNDPIVLVLFTTLAGIIVFAKYPVVHYQFVNFILIVFCAMYLLAKIKQRYISFLFVVMLSVLLIFFKPYGFVKNVSNQLPENRPDTVYSVLKDWTPFWSADIFKDQLEAVKPKLDETPLGQ